MARLDCKSITLRWNYAVGIVADKRKAVLRYSRGREISLQRLARKNAVVSKFAAQWQSAICYEMVQHALFALTSTRPIEETKEHRLCGNFKK
jgi:hypothetical protein